MSVSRIVKINELIRQLIAETIERELSLKPGVFITLPKVDTTKDLRYTRVSVSVFPEKESRYVGETLRKETPRLQRALHQKLYMKPLPRLSFILDTTEQEADKVEKILKELEKES